MNCNYPVERMTEAELLMEWCHAALEAARTILKHRLLDNPHSGAADALDLIDAALKS